MTASALRIERRDLDGTLGMRVVTFGEGRRAPEVGQQKINLHKAGHGFLPKVSRFTSGSADLCLITRTPPVDVIAHLSTADIPIEEGPVERSGAMGAIRSIYLRDPDHNLLKFPIT